MGACPLDTPSSALRLWRLPSHLQCSKISFSWSITSLIKSLSRAYLWKYRRELNETWYIDGWPSEEVQSVGKGARVSIFPAICLSGVISLTYTLDVGLIFFMIFTFFVENHLIGNTKPSFLVLWFVTGLAGKGPYISPYFCILCWKSLSREHKTEFLMV